jgi:hypothetical protein
MDKNKVKELQAELNSIEQKYSDKPQWKIDRSERLAIQSKNAAKSNYKKNGNPAAGKYGKAILQYDLDGNFVKEWKGAFIAAEFYGVGNTQITDIVNGRGESTLGFMWKKKVGNKIQYKITSLYEIQNPKCSYCNKIVARGMYNRWHGENCKHK